MIEAHASIHNFAPPHNNAPIYSGTRSCHSSFYRDSGLVLWPEPGSEDGDRFDILTTLVEAYEARRFPIDAPDPIEAIRFRMEQGGLTVKDLVPSIGQPNRVYEVLSGKRKLSIEMIRKLHRNLGIPAESLIGP